MLSFETLISEFHRDGNTKGEADFLLTNPCANVSLELVRYPSSRVKLDGRFFLKILQFNIKKTFKSNAIGHTKYPFQLIA